VQLHFIDELQAYCCGISFLDKGDNPKPSSRHWDIFHTSIDQAAPEDLVTYLMVIADVGLASSYHYC